jgi:hypothetical protein
VPKEFVSVDQLADRWNTSARVIYGMRYRGEGPPAMSIGRELRFRLSDVEAWELERLEAPKSDTRQAQPAKDATRRTDSRRRQARRELRKEGVRDEQTSA